MSNEPNTCEIVLKYYLLIYQTYDYNIMQGQVVLVKKLKSLKIKLNNKIKN